MTWRVTWATLLDPGNHDTRTGDQKMKAKCLLEPLGSSYIAKWGTIGFVGTMR